MLIVIAPAKTLDFETEPVTGQHSQPEFLDRAAELVDALRNRSPADLAELMGISAKLADLNYERFTEWHRPFTPENAKPAVLTFKGDVYTGLDAERWQESDFEWAQERLRILSGLYGVLRPLDLIQPYRLEMGTRLPNRRGRDLYAFWDGEPTRALNAALDAQPDRERVLVNLASNEYWKALDPERIDARIVTPTFRDWKNGKYKFVSFYAKKARGTMASWLVRHRVESAEGVKDFDGDGYRFDPERSEGDQWVFVRDETG